MNMKAAWEALSSRWEHLALHEKRVVAIGATILVLFLAYQCIWSPLQSSLENQRQRIVSGQKTLLWMKSADKIMQANVSAASNKTKPVSLAVFLGQMQRQIKLDGLSQSLAQLKQSGNASVDMQFQRVEFDKLMTFLLGVMKEYHVSITRMSVLTADVLGYVNAEIEMQQISR